MECCFVALTLFITLNTSNERLSIVCMVFVLTEVLRMADYCSK